MDANVFFRSADILITPAFVRFGPVSYQVAAISSVAVFHRPRLNPIAITLVLAAVALGVAAYLGWTRFPDYSLWAAIAAPVALILGVIWQHIRPILEYRFVMKTSGNETETLTTFDRAQAFELRDAIESAFMMQRPMVDTAGSTEFAPPPEPEVRSEDGLLITRDWLVANPELAPR